ncbi:MAG: AbrB/MazE/SpoVT family DNA-binding domain-containing protein [Gammaproteobacteria bacterium]|nr:AbrB/MazE/SpoVT family DNA-binding domain-containing protein [Gammaproteobacteria bacterium]
MYHAKVTSKGQITLPAGLRAKLKLMPGSRVDFEERPDGSFVIRRKTGSIRDLCGIVKYDGPPVSIEEMNEAIRKGASERFKRSVS